MHAQPLRTALLAAFAGVLLAGCGAVEFDHPLSDEKTSVVDERLIGVWEPTPETLGTGEPSDGMLIPRLAVGRDRKQANLMEALSLEVKDGYVHVNGMDVRATKIGAHRYLSLRPREEGARWWVIRYELPEQDLLRFRVLDQDVFAQAVKAGELAGEVRQPEDGNELSEIEVRISSEPAAVRAWIEAHAATCVLEDAAGMRRLVRKPAELEALEQGPDEEDDAEGE